MCACLKRNAGGASGHAPLPPHTAAVLSPAINHCEHARTQADGAKTRKGYTEGFK